MKRLVVFGGNGFVGSCVCQSGLHLGAEVISVNRSGRPQGNEEWIDRVKWVQGDISDPKSEVLLEAVRGATGAVSCVGAFGSNEVGVQLYALQLAPLSQTFFLKKQAMLNINGIANVRAIDLAIEAGEDSTKTSRHFTRLTHEVFTGYQVSRTSLTSRRVGLLCHLGSLRGMLSGSYFNAN